jgi:hypothetical protein
MGAKVSRRWRPYGLAPADASGELVRDALGEMRMDVQD